MKFSKVKFWPKPNSAYTKPLNLEFYWNWIALYFNKRLEKLKLQKMPKKITFVGDWAKLRPKFSFLKQSQTKYLEQIREIQ